MELDCFCFVLEQCFAYKSILYVANLQSHIFTLDGAKENQSFFPPPLLSLSFPSSPAFSGLKRQQAAKWLYKYCNTNIVFLVLSSMLTTTTEDR